MTLKGKGMNLQVLAECCCYLFFGHLLFQMTWSGDYLNYVTPRMKPYLYGMVLLMLLWAAVEGRYLLTPQYKIRLTRSCVLMIPILLISLRPGLSGGSSMIRDYASSKIASTPGTEEAAPLQAEGAGTEAGGYLKEDFQDSAVLASDEERPWYALNGLDENTKTIVIADEDYYTWMYELGSFPEKYEGYTVEMKGFIYRSPEIKKEHDFALVRLSMWCCAADLAPMGLLVDNGGKQEFQDDTWVVVKGSFGITEYGSDPILKAQSIEPAEKPEVEYVYPYF